MNANMKRRFVFCLGAMLFAGTLAAQTPVPEWQAGVDKVKSLIKTNPEQASDAAGELLKGKNKKNVELVTSVARVYLDAGQLKEAETYLEMARKADNKAPAVSVLEVTSLLPGKISERHASFMSKPSILIRIIRMRI